MINAVVESIVVEDEMTIIALVTSEEQKRCLCIFKTNIFSRNAFQLHTSFAEFSAILAYSLHIS
jgi:hypothetical protein